ncbi:tetratricopeptide repeat protein [Edaphobacter paludis]|uniref:Tetratricopeptide repeat protein n=1 Tax=Edaphobacter paludis TaxID=3035702 RepID=A0AAU7CVR7_9BACT
MRPAEGLLANPPVHLPASYLAVQEDAFQKGLIALKENRLQTALDEFATAERERPDNALARNFRGIVLARLGRNIEAADEYREAIRIDPQMEAAYRNLGFLYWTEQQLDRAREELKHAVELSPDDSFAHYYLGRVQLDAQLYVDAFAEFHQSGMSLPDDPDFLIAAATGYLAIGQQEEARKIINRLAIQPLSAVQDLRIASLLLAVHENDTAIHLLEQLSNTTPHDRASGVNFDLALAYLLAGRYQQAIDQAQPCTDAVHQASAPSRAAQAWSLIGIAYARLGNAELAVNALRHAAILAPTQEEHWLNLTRELMELSQYANAISATHEGLTFNPKSYSLNLRLGAANLAAGHYDEAGEVFRTLVAAGDPLPTSYIGLAQVLLRTGHAEEAVTELADARKKLGPSFLISYFQGLALDRTGKLLEAISAFQEAVQQNPDSAEAHLGLGKTELVQGRVSDAIVQLEEALRLSPGNVQALRLLSQAYRRAGEKKSSAKYAEAPAAAPVANGDLVGDFLLPPWQNPQVKNIP